MAWFLRYCFITITVLGYHTITQTQTALNGLTEVAQKFDDLHEPIINPEETSSQEPYLSTCADEKPEQKFKIKISGYVKYECFEESRQTINARQGTILVAPKMPEYDPNHVDIYDAPHWNMAGIRSRIYFDITGPKLGHTYTSAKIGADFADAHEIAALRLRDASIQLYWEHDPRNNTRLIMGQSHHPLVLGEPYPATLGYSEGILINPAGFAPQVTIFRSIGSLMLIGSLNTFIRSLNGSTITAAERNAVVPSVFLAAEMKILEKSIINAGVNFHRIVPRLHTDAEIATLGEHFATTNGLNSWIAYLAAMIDTDTFKAKFRWLYAENGQRYYLLSGFATKAEGYNPETDERHYTNLRSISYWTELIYRYKKAEIGIFMGYVKNIGSRHQLVTDEDGLADTRFITTFYPDAAKTDYVLRIQPRLQYYLDPLRFGMELEYCCAGYGQVNKFGRIEKSSPTSVARLLFVACYVF
ncbi:hypothetical protein KJZ61_00155 [Candidatus Dependentiae bacterium]|nr:hypothetical protein [Candidatus Dependentiae bacterium]